MWNYEAEEAKAVIVIVHGAMEYHGRYEAVAEMWNHIGYHVVMGDLPSHGTTSRNRGHIDSFDEYIEEVKLWVKEARKYRLPIFLFGHSMGGLIVIRMMQETKRRCRGYYFEFALFRGSDWTLCSASICFKNIKCCGSKIAICNESYGGNVNT